MKRIFNHLIQFIIYLLALSTNVNADSFESLIMPGPVIEGHKKYEEDCKQCHNIFNKKEQNSLCLKCHKDINKDIENDMGYHGKYSLVKKVDCKTCHIEHKGRTTDIVKLDSKTFQHQYTDFKLKHSHTKVQCSDCHLKNKKYREASQQCYSCHKKNDIHKKKLGKKCENCHNEKNWSSISFDHSKTDFSLTGKHKKITCNSCHINNKYSKTPKKCNTCHQIDDVHRGKNGKQCNKCHNTRGWKSLKFDHDKDTDFKLTGRHKKQTCKSCHAKNPYKVKIKSTCISCHLSDDKHNDLFGSKCDDCHRTKSWDSIKFNHKRDTKYALKGKHKKINCISCHLKKVDDDKLSKKCKSCHAFDDVHKNKGKTDCKQCHSTGNWYDNIKFDHDLTNFPLLGLHAVTACNDCHIDHQYQKTQSSCISCHIKNDTHKKKLGLECQLCHSPNDWKVWQFNHDNQTNFKIDGAHKKMHCHRCHQQPASDGIETGQTCGSCHADDDVHLNQFGQRCEQCHTTKDFHNIDFSEF